MAANAIDQTRRMLSLVTYLRERPGAHVSDVARAFGISEDQLISDLDVLPMCGRASAAAICSTSTPTATGSGGTTRTMSPTAAARRRRGDRAARRGPRRRHPAGLREGDRQALLRATAKLETAAGEAAGASSRLSVTFEAEGGVFADVDRAISERRRLWLRYYSPARDELTEREVDPIRLFAVGHT